MTREQEPMSQVSEKLEDVSKINDTNQLRHCFYTVKKQQQKNSLLQNCPCWLGSTDFLLT